MTQPATLYRVFDSRFGTAEIGLWIAPEAQGTGLITRAAERMIAWALGERRLNRIEWRCVPSNKRSMAVAMRLGMARDGVLREAVLVPAALWDSMVNERRRAAEQTDATLRLEGVARSDAARAINERYINGEISTDEMVRQTIALHRGS
jgi:Acetyltransferase (GNAT) domain/Antitoxin VbhA